MMPVSRSRATQARVRSRKLMHIGSVTSRYSTLCVPGRGLGDDIGHGVADDEADERRQPGRTTPSAGSIRASTPARG